MAKQKVFNNGYLFVERIGEMKNGHLNGNGVSVYSGKIKLGTWKDGKPDDTKEITTEEKEKFIKTCEEQMNKCPQKELFD